jgi:hypothetical protein
MEKQALKVLKAPKVQLVLKVHKVL